MAVNTAARRYSMIALAAPAAQRISIVPTGADWAGSQRYHGLGIYSGLTLDALEETSGVGFGAGLLAMHVKRKRGRRKRKRKHRKSHG